MSRHEMPTPPATLGPPDTPGPPVFRRVQTEHNAGRPFPPRGPQPLRKGPTVASP